MSTQYSSTLNITVGVKKELSGKRKNKIYGLWIPRRERKNIAAISIESRKNKDRVATGELFNIMLSGTAGKRMINWGKEEILSSVLEELVLYFPNIIKHITFTKIYRWLYAEPMSPIGRSRNIKEYRVKTTGENQVFLAGDYMGMPFTEGAAEIGKWAASKIILAEQAAARDGKHGETPADLGVPLQGR